MESGIGLLRWNEVGTTEIDGITGKLRILRSVSMDMTTFEYDGYLRYGLYGYIGTKESEKKESRY